MRQASPREGFTLIELLVVIAIIAILSVVVVLTLNPAEMLRRSRDSNRLSDLSVFQSAMNVYTQDRAMIGSSLSMGTSSVIYISIPDPAASTAAGSDCSNLGFPAGGTYHCAGPSFFRRTDGTGWIPVNLSAITTGSPLGQLPTDPTNVSSTGEYYEYTTNGTNWKMAAVPESTQYASQFASFSSGTNQNLLGGFPGNGWVAVPGNSTFGTHNFTVMKYDAVCSDGNGNYVNTPVDPSYANTYDYAITACPYTAALPGGSPIVDISQTQAAAVCASIGAHLITNNEWQTIAWNAEGVASNWAGGVVGGTGAGALYSGHNDNVPAYPSVAGSDSQGCVGTDGPASCGGTGSATSQIRTFTLSNGQVVWDMAGNIWQWTNNTITGTNEPHGTAASWNWYQFNDGGMTYNGMTQSTVAASTPSWNSSNGVGELYSLNGIDGTIYGFLRGGLWNYGGTAGVETLYLYYGPGAVDGAVGFRCAR